MTNLADGYETLDDGPEIETKVQGSRFLGQAFHAPTDAVADTRLAEVEKRHYAATHHCWARRTGPPEAIAERWDDDGEPNGTGGPPILAPLAAAGMHQALIVVTRYYGGTKLGTGGLARAYGDAAKEALAAAPRRTVWREAELRVACDYPDVGTIEAIVSREGTRVRRCERLFGTDAGFVLVTLRSDAPRLESILRESTAGRARVQVREI